MNKIKLLGDTRFPLRSTPARAVLFAAGRFYVLRSTFLISPQP